MGQLILWGSSILAACLMLCNSGIDLLHMPCAVVMAHPLELDVFLTGAASQAAGLDHALTALHGVMLLQGIGLTKERLTLQQKSVVL